MNCSKIPKIIHQTWKTNDIPNEWKISRESWKKIFPDYEYILWTDEMNRNLVKTHYPDLLNIYDNFEYNIQRADMIRYCILKLYGGIYSDLDIQPLSREIEKYWSTGDDLYLVETPNFEYSFVSNFFMVSSKGCEFWDIVLNYIKNNKLPFYVFGKHLKVYMTTGPFVIQKCKNKYEKTFGILPRNIFAPCSINDFDSKNEECSKNTLYIKQLKGQSWVSWDTTFFNFLNKYKFYIGIIIGILLLLLIQQTFKYLYIKNNCQIICKK